MPDTAPPSPPATADRETWHALDPDAALGALESTRDGLAEAEAAARLQRHGPNRLPAGQRRGPLERFARQFHNLLIYVLLGSAILSAALGHGIDAAVILAVVVINAVIGYVQEGRAEQALQAIMGMIDPKAMVLRDGRRETVAADRIVPGDVVAIEAGDRVPADLRLIRARGLKVDEAALTGESVPVEKAQDAVDAAAPLADRTSMAFSGTFVAAGQGLGVAVATGPGTELGRVSALISAVDVLKTPLIRQMDGFARQLTIAILAIAALTFLFALFVRAYPAGEAFMSVVGLAVAAIPEGLPAIMTITLAIGVRRMAGRNALIRRLPAVETLGSVSVICSDKTGTLTRNEMTARSVVTAEGALAVSGAGYAPHGGFTPAGAEAEIDPAGDPLTVGLVRAGLLCNDAELRQAEEAQADETWRVVGDPMEGALMTLALKAGLDPELERKRFARNDEIPFDTRHRFMATLHHGHEDGSFVLIKGAPERVLAMCAAERGADGDRPIDAEAWHRRAEALAADGQRVLAFAAKPARAGQQDLHFEEVEQGAVLLGFVGFIDPPREAAIAAVADCRRAGIRVVMITGDHAETARAIARQLGLAEDPAVLTGRDLEALDPEVLRRAARETSVFARTTPEDKLRLVEALQADGSTVAMTGDGVNDAPALKRADVGVAMGVKGTEAAKEAAEMVLADDDFASIVAAVREGRTVYDNLMKVIAWTLPTNGGEALTIIAAIAFGLALPVTPVQILWINMITAVALGVTLGFEPTEPGAMRRPPRPSGRPILTGTLLWRIVFVSGLFVAGAFGMFAFAEARGLPVETARTLVVNTLVVMEIFYLFSVRYVHGGSITRAGILGTPAVLAGVGTVVAAQLAFTYLPWLQVIFDTRPVGAVEGAAVLVVGVVLLLVVEAEKAAMRAFRQG
ncbi:MAG: cation-transporting P-type ATPase [Azospirillaceae bacterium]